LRFVPQSARPSQTVYRAIGSTRERVRSYPGASRNVEVRVKSVTYDLKRQIALPFFNNGPHELLTMTSNPVANFADYKKDLEDLYTRFQYNKVVGHQLMSRAMSLERAVRGSVLILLAISLFTGAFPILNGLKLTWIWATATILATLLTLHSLIEGSGSVQFQWFRLAAQFQTWPPKWSFSRFM